MSTLSSLVLSTVLSNFVALVLHVIRDLTHCSSNLNLAPTGWWFCKVKDEAQGGDEEQGHLKIESGRFSVCVALICSLYFRRPDENGGRLRW